MKTPVAMKKQEFTREYPAADNYLARVVAITDMGVQPGFEWKGEVTRPAHKVEITYELVTSEMSDGRPFWVSESVSFSTASKQLAQRCVATNTPIEDISGMIGKPVMLTVTLSDKGYPRVANVAGVPSGIPVPELRNPSYVFDWNNPDMEIWEKFPEFKKERIMSALNFEGSNLKKSIATEDESPF